VVHRDRPVRPEARPQGGVQLEVAQPDRSQAEILCLYLRTDPLDEMVQVQGPVSRVHDRQPDTVGRQLAERLTQCLGDDGGVVAERPWQGERANRQVRPRQDDPSQALRGGHQQALAGDAVRAVGQMIGVILERAERNPGDRRPLKRGDDLRRSESLQANLVRGHGRPPVSRSGSLR
jgi:hypothetical protein